MAAREIENACAIIAPLQSRNRRNMLNELCVKVCESLRSRLGWQVAAETRWAEVNVRPYAQLSYDYEHKKDERSYSAGFVGGNSAMEISTANRTGGYGTLLAGINAELSHGMRLGFGASATISQPGAKNSAVNITLSAPF
jgi:outer membrane autotransporter protein